MAGIVEVEGRETRYREATTIHEKYASRPPALENMCLTQFNANYDMVTGKKKYNFDRHGAAGYSDTRRIISWRTEEEEAYLPIIIKLGNNMGLMQLRTKPAVIRFHQYHHEKDPHRFIYTELLFLGLGGQRKSLVMTILSTVCSSTMTWRLPSLRSLRMSDGLS